MKSRTIAMLGTALALLLVGLPLLAPPAQAAIYTVTNTSDSGPDSLC